MSSPFDMHSDGYIGRGVCAETCPTDTIKIEDRGNKRILHNWNTAVELHACPECGRFFAPSRELSSKRCFPKSRSCARTCSVRAVPSLDHLIHVRQTRGQGAPKIGHGHGLPDIAHRTARDPSSSHDLTP